MKIFLDPGHGGSDPGAVAYGLVEKEMNLTTSLECKRVLEYHNVEVRISRTDDRFVSLSERARMANSWGANYFVSIHYNAGGGDGAEAIHSIYRGLGEHLATAVVRAINNEVGQNLRAKPTYSRVGSDGRDYYAVIRQTKMEAIIVECGFIDSEDRYYFDSSEEQKKMGKAIAYGILRHLGIQIKEESSQPGGTTNPNNSEIYGIVTASALNVRSGRGTSYPVIDVLKKGEKVKLLYLMNNWWSIDVPLNVSSTGYGFVSASYIKRV